MTTLHNKGPRERGGDELAKATEAGTDTNRS